MDEDQRSLMIRSSSHYSSSPGLELRYGEHGFVGDASVLRSVAFRIGILAALRSLKSKSATGVMITACGGSEEEYGVRIVDPDGGALIADWETLADSVANAVDPDEFVTLIEECVKRENISFDGGQPAEVFLGRDAMPSGDSLLEAAKQGISSVAGTIVHDLGIFTTPQLHWLVRARNKGMKASDHDYFQQLSSSHRFLVDLIPERATADEIESLVVDGANDVGGDKIELLRDLCDGSAVDIRNTSNGGAMPNQVGVDYIREHNTSGFGSSDTLNGVTFISDEAISENEKDGSDLFEESKHIDTCPNESTVQQVAICGAQTYENETHTGLPKEFQESHQSQTAGLHSDETVKLEVSVEEEESQDSCISTEQGVSLESNIEISTDSCSAKGLEVAEDPDHVIDKETTEIKRGESDDDAWVLVTDGKGDSLNAGSVMSETRDYEHLPEIVEPCNEKDSCSSPKVNDILAPFENVDDLIVLADTDKAEEVVVSSDSGSACDAQPQLQTSSGDTDKSQPSKEKESCSSPEINGVLAHVETVDDFLVSADTHRFIIKADTDKSEETGVSSSTESVCDAQTQPQTSSSDTDKPQPSKEKESCSSPLDNSIFSAVENVNDLLVSGESDKAEEAGFISGTESACDAQTQPQTCSGDTDNPQPSDEKESYSTPKVNGILAPIENADDLLVSAITHKAEEAEVISGAESACDAQPQPQTDSGETGKPQPSTEKESCSSLKVNGMLAPVENVDEWLVSADTDEAEEAVVISGTESAWDAQPPPQAGSGDTDKLQPSSLKVNGILAPVETVDEAEEAGVISGTESACDAQPPPQAGSGDTDKLQPSSEKESCSSPRANGVLAAAENLDDLLVSADTDKAEEVGVINESGRDAHNGSVDVDSGSNCLVNGTSLNAVRVNSLSDGNDLSVPSISGEASPTLSDVSTTEETGDLNVVGYASHTIAPQVNGIAVALPSFEYAANVEAKAENSHVDVDESSNYLVNAEDSDTRISFSCSEVNVDAPVDTLKNLPIPSDVGESEEAGACNDGVGIKPPYDMGETEEAGATNAEAILVHDNKLDSNAENGGVDVENGIDVNVPLSKAEEPSNPDDVVQVERSVTDCAGTANHDSEVNGGINGFVTAGVENKSESPIDNEGGVSSPCVNKTTELEVANEFESVPDTQLPSQISGNSIGLYASPHHGELENQAENSSLDAHETETLAVANGTTTQLQVSNQDDAQETYLGSSIQVNGDKRSNSLVGGVSLNTNIRFGSLEFVRNMCPKSEASSIGSRAVGHRNASSNLEKGMVDIRVKETFDEINSQQHVADNHCEHKVEDTLVQGSSEFLRDDSAMPTVANPKGDKNDGNALNGLVPTVGTNVDEESTSSLEGSATAAFDGESVGDEPVKKRFYYLIKIPKFDDEKLTEQIRLAEIQLEEKTRSRDAVVTEYRLKKETCQKLRANQQAAVLEERAARDLVRAKRKEIDSAQSLVNIAKDAMTIEDLDNKIANMEHTIQHETVTLNEEKKLIREIKQSKQMRDQLLLVTTKNQGVQQALDQKDTNQDRIKVLRKEMDALRVKFSEAEHVVKAAMKRLDSEHAILNELNRQLTLSNDVRQEAYSNLQNLRSQWSDKNKFFWSYRNVQRQANSYAVSGDKASLQSLCVNQVESMMKLWNLDDDFRRDYKRCNLRSTLRRLGTSDGRSLGPDEVSPLLAMPPLHRITAPVRDSKVSRAPSQGQPEPVAESRKADTKSATKVVEHKKPPNAVNSKPTKDSPSKNKEAEASETVKTEEDKEDLKARKEEEEMARKVEALRKEKEAARLKEARRLEEKAKFQEALERKRKQAEKAQAKAELKARKEAEEKEKEREKRARKKESKRGLTAEDTSSNPDSEAATNNNTDGPSEPTKELETREKPMTLIKRAQKPYAKQNKLKTILPPPPPLRNRGKRRMRQWMWVALTVLAILGLFFLGNLNLREISGVFSSWH